MAAVVVIVTKEIIATEVVNSRAIIDAIRVINIVTIPETDLKMQDRSRNQDTKKGIIATPVRVPKTAQDRAHPHPDILRRNIREKIRRRLRRNISRLLRKVIIAIIHRNAMRNQETRRLTRKVIARKILPIDIATNTTKGRIRRQSTIIVNIVESINILRTSSKENTRLR